MCSYVSAFELKNTSETCIQFVLEPWGNECMLNPGSMVRVEFRSPHWETLPISHRDDRIIVDGSEMTEAIGIWLDGELVG
jgi:hypothetical protein